ncbi:MAG: hypothetical protein A2V99_03540 [Spirochaetes bacterium RBG_16_67_19]|nr:MAG: hypothetical protein A2V99_03540 [Spirochaetes bacterium RBG_16_67_19]
MLLQPVLRRVLTADLVIVEQANKHLINYLLLLLSRLRLKKVAYWGHGWHRQQRNPNSLSAMAKKRLIKHPDWWFAYTSSAAEYLRSQGVEAGIITVAQNSLDLAAFQEALASVGDEELEHLRTDLGMDEQCLVGLFCGRLYRGKRIPFLLQVAVEIRRLLPWFHLVIIGEGPERELVEDLSKWEKGIHFVGAKVGKQKAAFFRLAQVFLNPGVVGLAILDAFAGGLPFITTDIPHHGPEIDYLENGKNGLKCGPSLSAFAGTVVEVLTDRSLHARLSAGAKASGQEYSLAAMVRNFKGGILHCLSIGRPREGRRGSALP